MTTTIDSSLYQSWCQTCCYRRPDKMMLTGYCICGYPCDHCGNVTDLAMVKINENADERTARRGRGDTMVKAKDVVDKVRATTDSLTLEQHAAAWWKDKGVDYYAHGQTDRENLYETWAEWAFSNLH